MRRLWRWLRGLLFASPLCPNCACGTIEDYGYFYRCSACGMGAVESNEAKP